MSEGQAERDQLVELVTREVLVALAERADICATPEKLRSVVANGADRVSFHGDAQDVPRKVHRPHPAQTRCYADRGRQDV